MRALIAVDGSDSAEEVVAAVAPWLRNAGAEVHLLTALDDSEMRGTPVSGGAAPGGLTPEPTELSERVHAREQALRMAETRTQAIERVHEERLRFLRGLAALHLGGVPHEEAVEASDDACATIIDAARDFNAELIVIGTHGRGGLRQSLMGSVAEAVIRRTPVPVFVVRRGAGTGRAAP